MIRIIKSERKACAVMALAALVLLTTPGSAKSKPIMTTDLLQNLRPGEPWDRSVFASTKMVMFQQVASGGTDATEVSKITLSYFTTNNCSGTGQGSNPGSSPNPSYTTTGVASFPINTTTSFGMVAASAWNVGNAKLGITSANMANIQSIAVTFKSTTNNTPQANFSGLSYACIPVTCTAGPSGLCTASPDPGTKSFKLKTTAAVGDPVDGGVIGCRNTGTSYNLFNLVVTTSDQSAGQTWAGGSAVTTGATSATNGAANTTTIVAALGNTTTYAARTCNQLSVKGGFTSGWFLPSGSITNSQLNCLFNNRVAIATGSVAAGGAGFEGARYWSSTEASSTFAWRLGFNFGNQTSGSKSDILNVRCSRAF